MLIWWLKIAVCFFSNLLFILCKNKKELDKNFISISLYEKSKKMSRHGSKE